MALELAQQKTNIPILCLSVLAHYFLPALYDEIPANQIYMQIYLPSIIDQYNKI